MSDKEPKVPPFHYDALYLSARIRVFYSAYICRVLYRDILLVSFYISVSWRSNLYWINLDEEDPVVGEERRDSERGLAAFLESV